MPETSRNRNTFKPHTGTKTSVLFVQKWNDDPKAGALCPHQDDYNIFFATMRKSGKDNSGDKIWRKITSSTSTPAEDELSELLPPSPMQRVVGVEGDFLQDEHGHLVVDHDLYNHEGLTEDGIAEAFIEFAKKENLSFFEPSPSVAPFDAARYQQLMDGLEAAAVSFHHVCHDNEEFRIDSEYYHPLHLVYESLVTANEHDRLGKLCNLIAGPFGSTVTTDNYVEDEEFRYIRGKDVQDFFLDNSDPVYIGTDLFDSLAQFHLKPLNILVTVVGMNFGKTALVLPKDCPAIFSCKSTLLKNSRVNPYFLVTYLSCKHGFRLIRRGRRGAAQPGINLFDLKTVPVPIFSQTFQDHVELIVNDCCQSLKEKSKELYQQAEDLLLVELGLQDWQPTEETVAVKSFAESFLSSDRFDAEYYQPKYDQVEEAIKGSGFPYQTLGSLMEPIQNGFDYREYTEEGTPYIRVGDVKNGQINFESAVRIPIKMADVDKPVGLQIGDILFTRKGSFGNSAVVTGLEVDGIISSEIMLVRLTVSAKQEMLPEYVSLFLNSKFGYLQVERRVHGVAYYSISQPDLAKLLIPILSKPQQQKIVDKIKSSFLLKQKSKQLLEIAKTGVERAILLQRGCTNETDEATATVWINEQLEALNIKLT